ncbi:hydroxypyruvate reductase [Gluconobacter albidus]|uniref:Hydroxypyruvate reductase n=1 Tax=Gluconobacter albidus TaxID=318683 RepID=A0A149TJZ4_9PROT|nr:glycerate kinase [Gluconobacter albidus]KXV48476.1 hydroxypyruvate reductase [Gluconobacter albidus]
MMFQDRTFLTGLFEAAVGAAEPDRILGAYLPDPPKGRTVVIGAGKGAAQLAAAFERVWTGPLSGVVVTRYGNVCPTQFIRVLEASHPVPDEAGLRATDALFDAVRGLGPDDLVVALICGGGSALLPCPPAGLTLADEAELNRVLLASGAPISVMNSIRKQVSGIKGGRLAAAASPAKVVSLVVSDVPFDDPAQVASGPTVPDMGTREDARRLVKSWKIQLPAKVRLWLDGEEGRAPLATDPVFSGNTVRVIASAHLSLEAAAEKARQAGIQPVILSDAIEGEARDVGKVHAALVREIVLRDRPFRRPVVLLSGGETTVTMRGQGRGGRNTEFLLAFALAAEGFPFLALAADTDGIDGSEDNAGAFADGASMERLREKGASPIDLLMENDAYTAFEALGDLFVPGPTGTNVNDFRAILIRQE